MLPMKYRSSFRDAFSLLISELNNQIFAYQTILVTLYNNCEDNVDVSVFRHKHKIGLLELQFQNQITCFTDKK